MKEDNTSPVSPQGKREPWGFCEKPDEKCTMNYCDDNGCRFRKRNLVNPAMSNDNQQPSESAPKIGDRIDYIIGNEWILDYATVIDIKDGKAVCEMNYPGHDGCRWTYLYTFDQIRKSVGR